MSKIDIKAMIKDLKKNELTELISVAQEVLSTLFNSSEIRDNVKESRFSKGYECPKCQCKDVNKNGKSNGRQRYICKRCRTSFDEFTMSPFSNTKLGLDKWIKYCELMILGLSIRKCAEEVGVGVKTSFYMRHRILDVINLSLKNDKVEGIVEVDECFIKESFKGNHSKSTTFVMPRNPRKRGKGKNDKKKRGISKEQICIETAIDRKGNILMSAVCNGRITTNQIINFFDNKICEDATFCVDSHKSYMAIKDKLNIELKQVPRGKSMIDSVYHLQHINALHSSFKRWLMTFNGVSTKYINNYLAWFKFLQLSKKNKKNDRIKDMLVNVATKDTCITRTTIRNRFIELTQNKKLYSILIKPFCDWKIIEYFVQYNKVRNCYIL